MKGSPKLARILIIASLVCAVLAFFSVHVGDVSSLRLATLGLGFLVVAALL